MSNITSIKDLLGKRWRLKETMYKNEVMVSNHSIYISSYGSNKNLFTYYYGNQQFISTTSFMVGQNTILQFTGEDIYNFYYKTYYGDYGNRPRIVEFNPELTVEDIIVNGYINGASKTAEQIFIEWWNYNTEEIVEKTYVGVLSVFPTAVVNIKENGTYDVSKFAIAHINVPIPEGYLKPEGTFETNIEGTYDVTPYADATFTVQKEQASVVPTKETQTLTPSENRFFDEVIVEPIPEEYLIPEGTLEVSTEGIYDVTTYASVKFDVKTEEITTTPTKETQTFTPSENKFIDKVVVNPIPSEYLVPSGNVDITNTEEYDVAQYAKAQIKDENLIPENIAKDVNVLGVVGTHEGGAGGIIPSGTIDITENGTYDVTEYESANVNVKGIDTTDATATANDILAGKTAYVNDVKVEGNIPTYSGSNSEMTEPLQSTLKKLLDTTKSCSYLFGYFEGTSVDDLISYNDTENVEKMEYMFYICSSLKSIPLLNTSNVTNMNNMFNNCINLTTIPLLNTSNVTNMDGMFKQCYNLVTIPLLDTSKVTDISAMFQGCRSLKTISQLDTSNVTNMGYMFAGCSSLTIIPLLDTSKVTFIYAMFSSCRSLKTIQMYGMKVSFDISASTQFEESDLVTIISNCQVVTSSTTLTMGSTNLAKLENVYVKETGVELYEGITCRPCVICESTDDGAMLVTTYASNKGWTLA